MKNKYLGSDFDEFLKEEGVLAETEAAAAKRIITFQIQQLMKRKHISKTVLADRMKTSRSALTRLLEPSNISITLLTLEKAALALGKKLKIELS